MTNKHTPAPWFIDNQNIVTTDYMIISNLPRQIYDRGTIAGENECQEKLANARLIAAAPELLEALEDLLDYGFVNTHSMRNKEAAIDAQEDKIRAIERAEAAINKAKGL